MDYEWDETKRLSNLQKHGIDFEDAARIWAGTVLDRQSHRAGEQRWITTGAMGGRVVAVVWTWREGRRRLVSARAARRHEREDYAAHVE